VFQAQSDDEHKAAHGGKYVEDVEILRVPLALATVRLLQVLPPGPLHTHLPGYVHPDVDSCYDLNPNLNPNPIPNPNPNSNPTLTLTLPSPYSNPDPNPIPIPTFNTLLLFMCSVLLKVCQFMKSRSIDIRTTARETMVKIAQALGAHYMPYIIKEMKSILTRGYQVG
jgi:hypothetical protein